MLIMLALQYVGVELLPLSPLRFQITWCVDEHWLFWRDRTQIGWCLRWPGLLTLAQWAEKPNSKLQYIEQIDRLGYYTNYGPTYILYRPRGTSRDPDELKALQLQT